MICIKTTKKYCCEDISHIENYEKAIVDSKTWHCHHRKEIDENLTIEKLIELGLYYNRPAEELIFLEPDIHIRLHTTGKSTWNLGLTKENDERVRKYSKTLSKSITGKNNPFYGKHHSEEARNKMSIAHKGIKHSEEARNKMSIAHKEYNKLHPRCWMNNGDIQTLVLLEKVQEYLDKGWVKGRLK